MVHISNGSLKKGFGERLLERIVWMLSRNQAWSEIESTRTCPNVYLPRGKDIRLDKNENNYWDFFKIQTNIEAKAVFTVKIILQIEAIA